MSEQPLQPEQFEEPDLPFTMLEQRALDLVSTIDLKDEEELAFYLENLREFALQAIHINEKGEPITDPPSAQEEIIARRMALHNYRMSLDLETRRRAAEEKATSLKEQATIDSLTGLLRKEAFQLAAQEKLSLAQQNNQPFAILAMDLSGFKGINDAFSHAAGDQCLQIVGEILRTIQPEKIVAGRLGGDEFALAISDMTEEEVNEAEAQIKERMRSTTFEAQKPVRNAEGTAMEDEHGNPVVEMATVHIRAGDTGIAFLKNGQTARQLYEAADAQAIRNKEAFYRDNPHLNVRADDLNRLQQKVAQMKNPPDDMTLLLRELTIRYLQQLLRQTSSEIRANSFNDGAGI